MLGPTPATQKTEVTTALRLRSPRQVNRRQTHVRDGFTLPTLRATGGPPGTSVFMRNGGPSLSDGGHRPSSIFDLPASGQVFLERLRGQSCNANPLLRAFSDRTGRSSELLSNSAVAVSSTAALQAQNASLRPQFRRIDGTSRFLLALGNGNRSDQGFGFRFSLGVSNSSISLIG